MGFGKKNYFVFVVFTISLVTTIYACITGYLYLDKSINDRREETITIINLTKLSGSISSALADSSRYLSNPDLAVRENINKSLQNAAFLMEQSLKHLRQINKINPPLVNISSKDFSDAEDLYSNLRRFFNVDSRISDEKAYLKKIISIAENGLINNLQAEVLSNINSENIHFLEFEDRMKIGYLLASLTIIILFNVTLFILLKKKLLTSAESETTDNNSKPRKMFQDINVLVVEDNRVSMEFTTSMLEHFGCNVFQSSNGEEAIKLIEKQQNKINFVLMDCEMPVMDGYETTKKIKKMVKDKKIKDLTIVALTGKIEKSDKKASLAAGMEEHFLKPVKKEDYEKILTKCKPLIDKKAA